MKGPFKGGEKGLGGRYDIAQWLGAGGMQNVYLATDTFFGRQVALKRPKDDGGHKRFQVSAIVSAKINHSNVAKTLDYFVEGDVPYLIEEYVDGEDLSKIVTGQLPYVPPSTCARIFHQLARGLAASHHAGVIHRDLKPSNIMIVGGVKFLDAKITDFGIAKMAADEIGAWDGKGATTSKTIIGAIPYMSPESILDFKNTGKPSDVWAIAAIVYELLSGKCPFGTNLKAIPAILEAKVPPIPTMVQSLQFRGLGADIYNLIVRCLNKTASDRPTADELLVECEALFYSRDEYECGFIKNNKSQNVGFISADVGNDLMYHRESFYGDSTRAPGTRIWFGRHPGHPNDRAFPIVRIPPEAD